MLTFDTQSMLHTMDVLADSLSAGQIYYFKIQAVNDVGDSEFSDVASAALAPLPAQLA